ncbi:polysaccharide biosynthesis protein [Roseomonas sp. CCTCC AB2023176]|uniref:polysaccharide biosynthesis protein n=1 Tax=Roseomonas sp. CCTCC AB2023176 TaxID=3342640 RepID=UPI0035D7948E
MNTDLAGILRDRTVLITGGTGSFGHAVVRRFLQAPVGEIRILSRDEKKQDDMRNLLGDGRVKFFLGDVRDYGSVHDAMRGVDFVFHAAALKQVPSCEFHPMEAVRTNVLGAENVVSAAVACGVSRVVALSTDKAVYPINAMGLSKAMMEKVVVAKSRSAGSTVLCCTRYGNVMASRGSVIPLFVKQIREGRDLTVTDPNMTRFLMSLDESVDLVLFAYANARPGDIFVQKAPACTVGVLAEAVRRIFDSRTAIRVIGTRHGEKLYESLVSREEMARAEDMGGFYRIPADARDLNYDKFFSQGEERISVSEDYTSHNTQRMDLDEVVRLLRNLDYVKAELRGEPATEYA